MSSFGHGYEPSGSLLGNQQVQYFYNDDFDIFEDDEAFLEFCHSLEFDPFERKTVDSSNEEIKKPKINIVPKLELGALYVNSSSDIHIKRKNDREEGMATDDSSIYPPPPTDNHIFGSPSLGSMKKSRPASMERQRSDQQITPRCESSITDTAMLVTPNDIRRRLGLIMAVTNNEGDADGYKQAVDDHFLPNARYILKYIGKCPYGPDYLELDGTVAIVQFWAASFLAIPDSFMDVKEVKIRVLVNGHSSASYKYVYTGTQVLGMVSDQSSAIIVSNPSDTSGTGVLAFQVEGENRMVRDVAPDANMLGGVRQARKIECIGTMTLYFDENKKVYKVENVHTLWNRGNFY